MKSLFVPSIVLLALLLTSCSAKRPTVGETGYYMLDTPSNNWNVGEVIGIYIGRRTPYKLSSFYDPGKNVVDLQVSDAKLEIATASQDAFRAYFKADVNGSVNIKGEAAANGIKRATLILKEVKTVDAPHTAIIEQLRAEGLQPGSIPCEYILDRLDAKTKIDVIEGLLLANATIELYDSLGVAADLAMQDVKALEMELGVSFDEVNRSSLVTEDIVIGYKVSPDLLETALRSCS